MKRFVTLILVLSLLLPAAALADLSESERSYLGAWSLYADNGKGTVYSFLMVFMDNSTVVRSAMTFENGELKSNNKASGDWIGFTSESVLLSLAGTDMAACIRDDGNLYLFFLEGMELCGVYSRCPDMSYAFGW